MASGRIIGLVVPVLASIDNGLNKIAGSPRPSRVCSTFSVHFNHGWLAHYFKTHHQVWQGVRGPKMMTFSGEGGAKYYDPADARKRIHKGGLISLTCTMITKEKDLTYVDNRNAEELAELLSCNSFKLSSFVERPKKDSGSLPSQDIDDIADHPLQIETFAEELKKDLVNINDDESQGSQKSIVRLSKLARNSPVDKEMREETRDLAKATKRPHCAVFSVFKGGKFLYKHQREFLQNMWSDLREKLASTSIDFIPSIKEDMFVVLESMKSFKNFDISHLEKLLEALFAQAATYDEARSISSEKGSKELLARQSSEARDHLHDAKTKENKKFARIISTKDNLESIKKEIDSLQKWMKNLTASLKQQQELLQIAQAKVFDIEEEITAIESISPLSDEAVESLKVSALHLEAAKEELKNLNSFA
ncbi:hypothetical protein DH2020_024348 [Rehmannia glutinosa]|uniref:Uncharacterized protein n=1 Tax=Rehmannia glutinosa TaxID=99300 RepID=A0ABR0W6V7_REHGL